MDRRRFLAFTSLSMLGLACRPTAAKGPQTKPKDIPALKTRDPRRALVVWYSQTGHTQRLGKLIAKTLADEGLETVAGSWREITADRFAAADVVVVGSPVFYVDVPESMRRYLADLPALKGVAAATFVTYGGVGHNEQNTAVRLLQSLTAHGAAPVEHAAFSNMSAFAPFWSMGNAERTLSYRHLPNADTYERVRQFARRVLQRTRDGQITPAETELELEEMGRAVNMRWWMKAAINHHAINPKTCVRCNACENTCPVGAIDRAAGRIDTNACLVCLGCVNNCPTGALEMEILNVRLLGFRRLCEQNGIVVTPPKELA